MQPNTARDFALQLGALGSLYLSLAFLLMLIFGIINVQFPDAADNFWNVEQAEQNIRIGIAFVVVFFPTYLFLTRLVNRHRRSSGDGAYLGVTRWLIYLSLVIGGGVLLGDLVAVIMTFLEGEVTARFALKALAVLVVVGVAFYYYLLDAKGYWTGHERKSLQVGLVAVVVVLSAVVSGVLSIDSPEVVREQKLDQQQLTDLQDMQWRIIDHLQTNDELPETLAAVYVNEVPMAPEDRAAYRYEITNGGFQLCATFAHPSRSDIYPRMARPLSPMQGEEVLVTNTEQWEHTAGQWCFERGVQN